MKLQKALLTVFILLCSAKTNAQTAGEIIDMNINNEGEGDYETNKLNFQENLLHLKSN